MESIRPGNTDPLPVHASQHRLGTLLLMFVGMLMAAIAALTLLWSS